MRTAVTRPNPTAKAKPSTAPSHRRRRVALPPVPFDRVLGGGQLRLRLWHRSVSLTPRRYRHWASAFRTLVGRRAGKQGRNLSNLFDLVRVKQPAHAQPTPLGWLSQRKHATIAQMGRIAAD